MATACRVIAGCARIVSRALPRSPSRREALPWVAPAIALLLLAAPLAAQQYGLPDRDQPGDAMIQAYLAREAQRLDNQFLENVASQEDWEKIRPQLYEQYLYMLGLWPLPGKTPLEPTVTGVLQRDGYVVENLHYQSRPLLYVTGNLYRPQRIEPGQRLPAVFYVCGHSHQGRSGNKTAYQSHGIWFARHGYICLVVDSLQLGEIAAIHHGTYRENRWWWHSRGYTPAGVEAWNGIRGIDYLQSRPDVDPQRIAVTGISGGGAATFWIAAADPRVQVAVPVSGMADLESYIGNRVINGHCDCMFLYNTFQWPWTRIAALIAPRPLLFTNSDRDAIFPMDANERVINRLERMYSLYGRGDLVDALVSIGGHAYRQDIRQGAYRFINTHLTGDSASVENSELDLASGEGRQRQYPISVDELRVFPSDEDLPRDELNTKIDQHFVPMAQVEPPQEGTLDAWKTALQADLRRVSFGYFPDRIPAAVPCAEPPAELAASASADDGAVWLQTEPGIFVPLRQTQQPAGTAESQRILLVVRGADPPSGPTSPGSADAAELTYQLAPRGVDQTCWTQKNPPNYVARSHVLLGRTVDTGRVWDVAAAARYLHARHDGRLPVVVAGQGAAGLLAAWAAVWEPEIAGVVLRQPPLTHQADEAPQLLNVLRVCDVPQMLGMLAPRPLTVEGLPEAGDALKTIAAAYQAAGSADKFTVLP